MKRSYSRIMPYNTAMYEIYTKFKNSGCEIQLHML